MIERVDGKLICTNWIDDHACKFSARIDGDNAWCPMCDTGCTCHRQPDCPTRPLGATYKPIKTTKISSIGN